MAKPILSKITTFDATSDYTIKFSYSGNQAYRNVLTVYDADSMTSVYSNNNISLQYSNVITANSLTNGKKYAAEIVCYDKSGVASDPSNKTYFWVESTPTFKFKDISTTEEYTTLTTQSPAVTLSYSQNEGDELTQFQFFIYNNSQELINSSDVMYDYSSDNTYQYKGLSSDTFYYIRATGVTKRGISCDTGMINIFIRFKNPKTYSLIYTTADDCGVVTGYTNFSVISPDSEDYIYEDGFIQLQDDVLVYSREFNISGDFTLGLRFKDCSNGVIFKCQNTSQSITVTQFVDCTGLTRYKLVATNGDMDYTIYSNDLEIKDTYTISLWIVRVNNVYGLYVYISDTESNKPDYWLGESIEDESLVTKKDIWVDLTQTTEHVEDGVVTEQEEEPDDSTIWIGGAE